MPPASDVPDISLVEENVRRSKVNLENVMGSAVALCILRRFSPK
jgi:hypothetical protein